MNISGPVERLSALDNVEKDILTCIQSSGQALTELSKDKPSMKQVDLHTSNFLKTLNHVEMELTKHINYLTQVSTGQAHEGSCYAAQKTLQMAWHRSEHARSKVVEMERIKSQMLSTAAQRLPTPSSSGIPRPLGPGSTTGPNQMSQSQPMHQQAAPPVSAQLQPTPNNSSAPPSS